MTESAIHSWSLLLKSRQLWLSNMNRIQIAVNLRPQFSWTINSRGIKSRKVKEYPEKGKTTYVYRNLPDPANTDFEEGEYLPRRLSYWPPDLKQYRPRQTMKPWYRYKYLFDLDGPDPPTHPEYTDKPDYPEITDYQNDHLPSKRKKNRLEWYKSIRNIGSVEGKMVEQSVTNRLNLAAVRLSSWTRHCYDLPLYQNLTRTNLHRGMPELYDKMETNDELKQQLATSLIDAALLNHVNSVKISMGRYKRNKLEKLPSSLNSVIIAKDNIVYDAAISSIGAGSKFNEELLDHRLDTNPFVSSFWFVGGLEMPSYKPYFTQQRQESSNMPMQYIDTSIVNLRSTNPLPPVIDSPEVESVQQPTYKVSRQNPGAHGYPVKWTHPSWLSGYWPDSDNHDFGYLSVMSLSKLKLREHYMEGLLGRSAPDTDQTVDGIAMMHSFAWLNSLAMYHGFSPYDEITYPFTTQSIVTDGKTWYFYIYQMNSHTFHADLDKLDGIKLYNNCWSSGPLNLYEEITSDGSIVGYNDKVVDLLSKFISRKTEKVASDVTLKPYLGVDTRDDETKQKDRENLRRHFASIESKDQRWHSSEARINPNEYSQGYRNPFAPSTIHWRRPNKWIEWFKIDRNKYTV